MPRKRMTWNKQAEQGRQASPPPQIPAVDRTEGPDNPAYYPDPEADKYKSGDPSSWAEDPHSPMSPESPPPAMPGNLTTEEIEHPGTSDFSKSPESVEKASDAGGGGGKKQASLKELAEQRATLCVRIASALMPGAQAVAVENKALELMDLDDTQLRATANTLKLVAGEDEEEEVEEEIEVEGGKKAAVEVTARLDKIEASMGKLVKAVSHFFGNDDEDMSDKELMAYLMAEDSDGDGIDQSKNDYPQGYDEEKMSGEDEFAEGEMSEGTKEYDEGDKMGMDDEESMLKAMLEEMDQEMAMTAAGKEGSAVEDATDPLATGATIQSGEGGNVNPDKYAPTPVVAQSDGAEKVGDPTPHGSKAAADNPADNDIELTAGQDPMGLTETSVEEAKVASADDELMQLYADLNLPKTAGEEEEEEEEEIDIEGGKKAADDEDQDEASDEDDDAKMAAKKAANDASLKPQPKVASQGAQRLGNVAGMPKAAASEISELQKMWEHSPDVSNAFGMPSSS